ncbi:hypothetical protein [Streptomyces hebeiensis]
MFVTTAWWPAAAAPASIPSYTVARTMSVSRGTRTPSSRERPVRRLAAAGFTT